MYHIYEDEITDKEILNAINQLLVEKVINGEEYNTYVEEYLNYIEENKVKSIDEKMHERALSFIPLSKDEIKKLSMDELVLYRKRERAYLISVKDNIKYAKERKYFHPILLNLLKVYHGIQNIKVETNGSVPKTDRPIIFAASHIGMYDVEIVLQAIKEQAYIFSGDEEAMYRTFDGALFEVNGTAYVDPEDEIDRKVSYYNVIKHLKNGINILWYPEGTWNLTESTVIMPIHAQIIEAAIETNAIIIPVSLDQRDKKHGIRFVVNIGDVFDPKTKFTGEFTKEKKIEIADLLRSEMARLKYDAFEQASRKDIDDEYYERFLDKRIQEWNYYNLDIIRSRMFHPNHEVLEKEVFEHLNEIEIGTHNAFLARVRKQYNDYHKNDIL